VRTWEAILTGDDERADGATSVSRNCTNGIPSRASDAAENGALRMPARWSRSRA